MCITSSVGHSAGNAKVNRLIVYVWCLCKITMYPSGLFKKGFPSFRRSMNMLHLVNFSEDEGSKVNRGH